ncbi:hypothetical protein [Microvirga sp. Mcv34]|uniref:hypothetical protein n=1 Tax=Microvirga sp. Mcv34 TaxID=2926016 RepID=UPI0021C89CEB|nr:hypothetical protein [Microvirga sp. Mcv34]
MPDDLARAAAAHSTEAHVLLSVSRELREAARRVRSLGNYEIDFGDEAETIARIADKLDRKRRAIMKDPK